MAMVAPSCPIQKINIHLMSSALELATSSLLANDASLASKVDSDLVSMVSNNNCVSSSPIFTLRSS